VLSSRGRHEGLATTACVAITPAILLKNSIAAPRSAACAESDRVEQPRATRGCGRRPSSCRPAPGNAASGRGCGMAPADQWRRMRVRVELRRSQGALGSAVSEASGPDRRTGDRAPGGGRPERPIPHLLQMDSPNAYPVSSLFCTSPGSLMHWKRNSGSSGMRGCRHRPEVGTSNNGMCMSFLAGRGVREPRIAPRLRTSPQICEDG